MRDGLVDLSPVEDLQIFIKKIINFIWFASDNLYH